MTRLFGSDGIKGIANKELSAELAFKLGQALVAFLSENTDEIPKIIVGRDTRISGHMLESALIAGLCSMGAKVESVGVIPSPAVALLVKKYKKTAGVSISASHKPMEYNGIKFFDSEGYKLSSEAEDKLEAYAMGKCSMPEVKIGGDLGKITRPHTALRDYVDLIKQTVGSDLSGMKVAIDCANGAAYECAKLCFKELGADVEMLSNVPNGVNINDNCGSAHMEGLSKFVVENKCNFGIAMDGDGDHLLACDEKGKIIDAKKISELCGICYEKHSSANDGLVMAVSLAATYKKSSLPMSKLKG